MRQMALWLGDRELDPMVLYAFKGNPNRRIYTALGWHPAIERDRMIAGTPVPEIGYVWSGATELLRKLDRWQASIREREAAAHRQSRTRRAPVPSTSAA
ncbi:MAG TPA: hypothetical protein VEH84_09920, partial [Alphaproteobacteria bacterium]|nr:hypothetical protein [Alphaproteobacteria bacterium]